MIDSITTSSNLANQIATSQITSSQTTSESFVNYLSNETSSKLDTTKKPDIKELMDFTNMSFNEASSILYGVIGSNEDTRDWNKILTSTNVLKTAKEETAKMYNSDSPLLSNSDETLPKPQIDIQEGNIKFIQTAKFDEITQNDVVNNSLYLASSNGNLLRNAGNTPQQIIENIDAFGFNVESLKTLAENNSIPTEIKTLLDDTISYYNNQQNVSSQSYSTFELLANSLNVVNNSKNE